MLTTTHLFNVSSCLIYTEKLSFATSYHSWLYVFSLSSILAFNQSLPDVFFFNWISWNFSKSIFSEKSTKIEKKFRAGRVIGQGSPWKSGRSPDLSGWFWILISFRAIFQIFKKSELFSAFCQPFQQFQNLRPFFCSPILILKN